MNLKDIDDLNDALSIDKWKLKIEYKKMLAEYEKMAVERRKAWITAISIIVPLFVGAGTILYGIWSENERAASNFEIKAIEIVMNASSPEAATNKTIVLSELFPDRLPKTFKERMVAMYGLPTQPSPQK